MLRTVRWWRHVVVGAGVLGATAVAGFGVIGAGDESVLRPEHFDAKQVTVVPNGPDGVRIREVVDIDFGLTERHGYQRIVPHDFGAPTDVVASSPDAADDISVLELGVESRIRIGDPNRTFTGQHRYVLEYTLPDAEVTSGRLAIDIIGTDETFTTDRFEVVVAGFDLSDTTCDTGSFGAFGGCALDATVDGNHVVVVEPLEAGDGLTVGGLINSASPTDFGPVPAPVDRNPSGFRPLGLVVLPATVLVALAVFVTSRHYGSNVVRGGGGAADAAFGDLRPPRPGEPVPDVPTYRVPDSRLAELATIEFVPPRGVEPWQAAALLSESVGDHTVAAWFSEMIAREAVVVDADDDKLLRRGPGVARLNAVDQQHLSRLFRSNDSIKLGKYSKTFTSVWKAIQAEQRRFIAHSGWWVRGAPDGSVDLKVAGTLLVPLLFVVLISGAALRVAGRSVLTAIGHPVTAVAVAVLAVAVLAFVVYRTLLPSRSATGSALTLRAESFRRFLVASEGRHVDWAWENDLLREYSAWAVALGAADAWRDAIEASNIDHPDVALRGPLFVHTAASSFRSAHTPPSSSGGGGGGGGGVGGGGGGGSSGSW
ncbi:MAG: DUF2207 domain-containing protein [Ilumatobacter sp.]|nr:DUF2207 domain-containing protein [Ilumatobacter sp.]